MVGTFYRSAKGGGGGETTERDQARSCGAVAVLNTVGLGMDFKGLPCSANLLLL